MAYGKIELVGNPCGVQAHPCFMNGRERTSERVGFQGERPRHEPLNIVKHWELNCPVTESADTAAEKCSPGFPWLQTNQRLKRFLYSARVSWHRPSSPAKNSKLFILTENLSRRQAMKRRASEQASLYSLHETETLEAWGTDVKEPKKINNYWWHPAEDCPPPIGLREYIIGLRARTGLAWIGGTTDTVNVNAVYNTVLYDTVIRRQSCLPNTLRWIRLTSQT